MTTKVSLKLLFLMTWCLLHTLSGCGVNGADTSSPLSKPSANFSAEPLSPADQYLTETANEDILICFEKAAYVIVGDKAGFTSPEEIPVDELFRFAIMTGEVDPAIRYDENSGLYTIPIHAITEVLDRYFETYSFDPAALTRYVEYNEDANTLEASALGFGTGSSNYTLEKAESIDDHTVQVTLRDGDFSKKAILAKIVDGNVKFLSCATTYLN